jgi:hypothetical protein
MALRECFPAISDWRSWKMMDSIVFNDEAHKEKAFFLKKYCQALWHNMCTSKPTFSLLRPAHVFGTRLFQGFSRQKVESQRPGIRPEKEDNDDKTLCAREVTQDEDKRLQQPQSRAFADAAELSISAGQVFA